MAGKWFLKDWRAPQRLVVGTLKDVQINSGLTHDGDTGLDIVPNDDYWYLLFNRLNVGNISGVLECEIHISSDWQDQHFNWVRSLIGGEITALGVWVDDDEHNSKTELHPMDVIFGSITDSILQENWIATLAQQRSLTVGDSLCAFRFAVASDDRAGVFLDGPPLAQWTRPVTFTLPYPPRPTQGAWFPLYELRLDLNANADFRRVVREDASGTWLDFTVTCLGTDYDGPGILTGEIVTFWTDALVPLIVVDPRLLVFDPVHIGDQTDLDVRIENPSQVDLVVTVSASPPGPFHWGALASSTIAPGTSLDLTVTFHPTAVGNDSEILSIQSNTADSPHSVALVGKGEDLPNPP